MKSKENYKIDFFRYSDTNEMKVDEQKLIKKAIEAIDSSYSPYSHFQVGAAILLENGEVVTGSNQENGAYPSGLCAERVALFYAGAKYPKVPIVSMAIAARNNGSLVEEPISPCGACRQVMQEYRDVQKKPFSLMMVGTSNIIKVDDVLHLLPFNFSLLKDDKE
ncbi:MAG: cytidine deaminase [Bacteroidales bacterium]|nr:cytidine deaminase [Bacteroidales bacterium]HPD96198.1 cytidine deaminase [Tenuifilaceae bacterium]HRX31787.1 cytidine deaminase [Tenuifilaceae bacterium]